MTGVWVLLGVLVSALVLGLAHRAFDGRFRGTRPVRSPRVGGSGPSRTSRRPRTTDTSQKGEAAAEKAGAAGESETEREDLRPLLPGQAGERATLVQFSSAFCAPCRATRHRLHDVAQRVPGVVHLEIDAENHLDLVRKLNILKTPTTLVLDRNGGEVSRATGVPSVQGVLSVLGAAVPS